MLNIFYILKIISSGENLLLIIDRKLKKIRNLVYHMIYGFSEFRTEGVVRILLLFHIYIHREINVIFGPSHLFSNA